MRCKICIRDKFFNGEEKLKRERRLTVHNLLSLSYEEK